MPGTELDLLYEDQYLIILNKPPKMHCINTTKNQLSLQSELGKHSPETLKLFEFGLINRIDYETSGIVVFAKNEETQNFLRSIWNTEYVEKKYSALTTAQPLDPDGQPLEPPCRFECEIGQRYRGSKKVQVCSTKLDQDQLRSVRPAESIFHSIEKIQTDRYRVEVQILTGVRHQIRAQLAFAHSPILGDELYSGEPADRLHLHASELTISTESTNIEINSPALFFRSPV